MKIRELSFVMDSSIENDENGLVLIDLNQYTRLEGIGYGGFARIYMIEEKSTKKIFAAKVFDRNGTTSFEEMKMFYKEIEIMSKLKSPFIIKFIGYIVYMILNTSRIMLSSWNMLETAHYQIF